MPDIHPTAIIDQHAQIADDVTIGPFCIIRGNVTISPHTNLIQNVNIRGPIIIGTNNTIYPFTCLGFAPQDRKFDPNSDGAGILIGNDNIIRESVTIHRATCDSPTTIGNDNYIMANAHFGHDTIVGNNTMIANGVCLGGHVRVFDNAIIGGGSMAHQFSRIGQLTMISGLVAIAQDVPPFCTVYPNNKVGSLNLIGLRRAGLHQHIDPLKQALNILYRQHHTKTQAIQIIRDQSIDDDTLVAEFIEFITTSTRGIMPFANSNKSND